MKKIINYFAEKNIIVFEGALLNTLKKSVKFKTLVDFKVLHMQNYLRFKTPVIFLIKTLDEVRNAFFMDLWKKNN